MAPCKLTTWLILMPLTVLTLSSPILTHALNAIVSNTTLPSARAYFSASYDGQDTIYLFGGFAANHTPTILSYTVSSDSLTTIGESLQSGFGSGVWAGNDNLFYFGGVDVTLPSSKPFRSEIWKYNASNANQFSLVNYLPYPSSRMSTFWDEAANNVHVIGGTGAMSRNVLSYSLNNNTVEQTGAALPSDRSLVSTVWDPLARVAYIFGGQNAQGYTSDILRYELGMNYVTKLNLTLPERTASTCAIWVGVEETSYILGGYHSGANFLAFRLRMNQIEELVVENFPLRISSIGCAYVQRLRRIYVFGGYSTIDGYSNKIIFIDL